MDQTASSIIHDARNSTFNIVHGNQYNEFGPDGEFVFVTAVVYLASVSLFVYLSALRILIKYLV